MSYLFKRALAFLGSRNENSSLAFFTYFMPVIIFNTAVSFIISSPLLKGGIGPGSMITDMIAFTSHYFFLNLAVLMPLYFLSFVLNDRVIIIFSIAFSLMLQTVLVIDTRVYTIFHFHLNPIVWALITTEGASDSVMLGSGTVITFLEIVSAILIAEIAFNIYLVLALNRRRGRHLALLIKVSKVLFTVGLCLIVADKALYAYADIVKDASITKNARLYPLYQPLTIKSFASKLLGGDIKEEVEFNLPQGKSTINYPKRKLEFDTDGDKRLNIIIIVMDGLRFDMLCEDVMPNTWEFSRENIRFENHYSGGNDTRFGLFSLLYGIQGTYWHDFLTNRISPILIDTLIDKGYDFKILSSTKLTYPEFRKTAFVRIQQYIEDSPDLACKGRETHETEGTGKIRYKSINSNEKDHSITEKFIGYMSGLKRTKPFFAMLFYDSSHQPYLCPEEFRKFQPILDNIDYFKNIGRENAVKLKNRYKNSVFYEDFLIGRLLSALKDTDLLKCSIVLITGEHGEEFYERGSLGHTSSFNDFQTRNVAVLHYPGERPRTVKRMTSHLDVVPTLMKALGCVSPVEEYAQGLPLLGTDEHEYVTVSNWNRGAVVDNEHIMTFSTDRCLFETFDVRNKKDFSIIKSGKDITSSKKEILLDYITRMSEFYK